MSYLIAPIPFHTIAAKNLGVAEYLDSNNTSPALKENHDQNQLMNAI